MPVVHCDICGMILYVIYTDEEERYDICINCLRRLEERKAKNENPRVATDVERFDGNVRQDLPIPSEFPERNED